MSEKHDPADKPEKTKSDKDKTNFPIRDFPDLRCLRAAYLKKDGKPIGVDSSNNPLPDEGEEDFGLTRSTAEEAWDFFRRTRKKEEDKDDLTEFLDDC